MAVGSDSPINGIVNVRGANGIVGEPFQFNSDVSNVLRLDSFLGQPANKESLYVSKVENDFKALESQLKSFNNETPRMNKNNAQVQAIENSTPPTYKVDTRTRNSNDFDAQSVFTLQDMNNTFAVRGSRILKAGQMQTKKLSDESTRNADDIKQESQYLQSNNTQGISVTINPKSVSSMAGNIKMKNKILYEQAQRESAMQRARLNQTSKSNIGHYKMQNFRQQVIEGSSQGFQQMKQREMSAKIRSKNIIAPKVKFDPSKYINQIQNLSAQSQASNTQNIIDYNESMAQYLQHQQYQRTYGNVSQQSQPQYQTISIPIDQFYSTFGNIQNNNRMQTLQPVQSENVQSRAVTQLSPQHRDKSAKVGHRGILSPNSALSGQQQSSFDQQSPARPRTNMNRRQAQQRSLPVRTKSASNHGTQMRKKDIHQRVFSPMSTQGSQPKTCKAQTSHLRMSFKSSQKQSNIFSGRSDDKLDQEQKSTHTQYAKIAMTSNFTMFQNDNIDQGLQALQQQTLDEEEYQRAVFQETNISAQMINITTDNIRKMHAQLKHHVLTSDYYHDKNAENEAQMMQMQRRMPTAGSAFACLGNMNKYIDLVEGTSHDVQVFGDEPTTLTQEEQRKMKEKGELLELQAVPILLRIQDCTPNMTYNITIRQIVKEQMYITDKKYNMMMKQRQRYQASQQQVHQKQFDQTIVTSPKNSQQGCADSNVFTPSTAFSQRQGARSTMNRKSKFNFSPEESVATNSPVPKRPARKSKAQMQQTKQKNLEEANLVIQQQLKEKQEMANNTTADLEINISNNHKKPNAQNCDISINHNPLKDRSKILHLTYDNEPKFDDDLNGKAAVGGGQSTFHQLSLKDVMPKTKQTNKKQPQKGSDNNNAKGGGKRVDEMADIALPNNSIYMSISSLKGCYIRITITESTRQPLTKLDKEEDKESSSSEEEPNPLKNWNKKQWLKHEDRMETYLETIAKQNQKDKNQHRFNANIEHQKNLKSQQYNIDGKACNINKQRQVRKILTQMQKDKFERLQNFNYQKNVLNLNKWDIYRRDMRAHQDYAIRKLNERYVVTRLLKLYQLTRLSKMVTQQMKDLKIKYLYKNAGLFLALKMLLLNIRLKKRFGTHLHKRMEAQYVHGFLNLYTMFTHKTVCQRATKDILHDYLQRGRSQELVFAKVRDITNKVNRVIRIFRAKVVGNAKMREKYMGRYFDKEKRFIQDFYEKKAKDNPLSGTGKAAQKICKIMVEIKERTIKESIFLYRQFKQLEHMLPFYQEQIEFLSNRTKYTMLLYNNFKKDNDPNQTKKIKKQKSSTSNTNKGIRPSRQDSTTSNFGRNTTAGQKSSNLLNGDSKSNNERKTSQKRRGNVASLDGKISFDWIPAHDIITRAKAEEMKKSLESDRYRLFRYEMKYQRTKKNVDLIEKYLFENTDAFIKADQSVELSIKKIQNSLDQKYKQSPIGLILYNLAELYERYKEGDLKIKQKPKDLNSPSAKQEDSSCNSENKEDIASPTRSPRFDNSRSPSKRDRILDESSQGSDNSASSRKATTKKKKSKLQKPGSKELSQLLSMSSFKPDFKFHAFNLQVQLEEIHRMIFKACSYNEEFTNEFWASIDIERPIYLCCSQDHHDDEKKALQ